eukprot:jgi/Mesen1/4765/ME000242S03943
MASSVHRAASLLTGKLGQSLRGGFFQPFGVRHLASAPAAATLAYEEILVPSKDTSSSTPSATPGDALETDHPSSNLNTALIFHGLFGTGRNCRTVARHLAEAANELAPSGTRGWRMVLLDLRNHGKSAQLTGFDPPHDIRSAARDVVNLVQGKSSQWGQVQVAIGHSLGGKVVLEYARQLAENAEGSSNVPPPKQVWVLDSVPGPIDGVNGDVEKVLATLGSLPDPIPSRRREDYLPFVENPTGGVQLDIVRAARSDRWLPRIIQQLEEAAKRHLAADNSHAAPGAASGSVRLHVLERAGHWLHMDNPQGLVRMLAPSLAKAAASSKQ